MSLLDRLGGQRNAGIAAAGAGGVLVLFLGWRHSKNKAQTATTAAQQAAAAAGYAQTASDPNQLYTGYDQLQTEIDQIRGTNGAGNPNPAPVPTPTPTGGSTPPAPVPSSPPPSTTPKPSPAPAPSSGSHTYTVQKNDSLFAIAKRLYGNGNDWQKLYANNKSVIGSNPNLIRPGEKLKY